MGDFPFDLPGDETAGRLLEAFDVEGKIPRALEALGPLSGRDVVLLDRAPLCRSAQLAELGARLTVVDPGSTEARGGAGPFAAATPAVAVDPAIAGNHVTVAGTPAKTGLPAATADAVVALWSAVRAPADVEMAEADRVLRPGGRLLVLQDYGRDDLDSVRGPERTAELLEWSRRDGWYMRSGFRIHVVHAFWAFESIDAAAALLRDIFGPAGEDLGARLRRPRIAHNVVVYHRSRAGEQGGGEQAGAGKREAGEQAGTDGPRRADEHAAADAPARTDGRARPDRQKQPAPPAPAGGPR